MRYAPLAVDRDDDIAVTLFLRRGVSGQPLLDSHSLELTDSGWRVLGGGGGPGDEVLRRRPALADLHGPAVSLGGGGTARSGRGLLGRRRTSWVSWAELRAAEEVAVLRAGGRHLPIAGHGVAVVLWAGEPPTVTALDAAGRELGRAPVRAVPHREYRDP